MKKIIVNSDSLITALENAKKAQVNRPVLPILEYTLIDVKDKKAVITGTDITTTLEYSINVEAKKGSDFSALISPKLLPLLKKFDSQPLTLEWDEANKLKVFGDQDKAEFGGDDPQDFPKTPTPSVPSLTLNTNHFAHFKELLTFSSVDKLRPHMCVVNLQWFEGKFKMCATNGHLLAMINIPEYNNSEKKTCNLFSLKNSSAKLLSYFLTKKKDETQEVSVFVNTEMTNASFAFGNIKVICRLETDRFPNVHAVIPKDSTTVYEAVNSDFSKQLGKAALIADPTTRLVKLKIGSTSIMSAKTLDFDNYFETPLGGSFTGNELEIGFNADFLKDLLAHLPEQFTVELTEPNKPGIFKAGNKLFLLMPVILNKYA